MLFVLLIQQELPTLKQLSPKVTREDTIPLIATLVENNATDSAKLIVGNKKPKFFILYIDTAKFDISKELRGCAGVKFR